MTDLNVIDYDKGMYDYAEWDCCDDPDVVWDITIPAWICDACGTDFIGRVFWAGGYLFVKPTYCSVELGGGWKQECCFHPTSRGKGDKCCQCNNYAGAASRQITT